MRAGRALLAGLLLALLVGLPLAGPAAAEPALRYVSRMGPSLPPEAPVPPTLSASDITRGPGLTEHRAGAFTARNWSEGASLAAARADGSWLGWSIAGAVPFDLGPLRLGLSRHPNGPQAVALQLRVEGGPWQTVAQIDGLAQNSLTELSADLSHHARIASTEFRLYGWGAGSWNGWLQLSNLPGAEAALVLGVAPGAPGRVEASKTVRVLGRDGAGCDGAAPPPAPQPALPGACLEYRIELENPGAAPVTALRVVDILPPFLLFVGTAQEGLGSAATVLAPAAGTDCAVASCRVELLGGELGAGRSGWIVIRTLLH